MGIVTLLTHSGQDGDVCPFLLGQQGRALKKPFEYRPSADHGRPGRVDLCLSKPVREGSSLVNRMKVS